MGRNALQSFDQLGHRDCAGHLNQNVQVVRHAVQSQNCATHFLGFESDHPVQWSLDRRRNEWKSIPCCPDQMDINRKGVPRHDPNLRMAWVRLIMALILGRCRLSRQLKSASPGASRQASASANAGCPFGRRRPTIGQRPLEAEFIRHACRPPKAFTPIKIGLPRRSRAKRRPPPTQRGLFRSAQADRRPKAPQGRIHSTPKAFTPIEIGLPRRLRARHQPPPTQKAFFSVGAGRPSAEGPPRPNSFGTLRARRRPPPTQETHFRSAQADRWPKAPQAEFIRRTPRQASASANAKDISRSAQADRRP